MNLCNEYIICSIAIFWHIWLFFKALKFDSNAGIEKVLEGTLEIFRWIFLFEPIGVRYFVPILLLQVGRVDDAYNLTKFLMFNYANNSDENLQVLVKKKDWLASLPKHDTTEGIFYEKLTGRYLWYHGYIHCMYLIDFCLKGKLKLRQAEQNWAHSSVLNKRDGMLIDFANISYNFHFHLTLADFPPTCIFHI